MKKLTWSVGLWAGVMCATCSKVAIALPPENDYQVFVERVRRKLNLAGVAGIYHAEVSF